MCYKIYAHRRSQYDNGISEEKCGANIGSKRGDICDVNFLWPQTNLSVEESDFNGAKITGVGKITEKDRLLSSQYKELNPKNRKKNRI